MKRVIVHIGFPRTATSWFQQNYFPKVENYSFISRKIIQEDFIHPSSLTFAKDALEKKYSDNEQIIISDEMITGRVRGGQVNHLFYKEYIGRILAVFPQAEFVIFIRNQAELIYSMYKLYVAKGGTFSLKRFLNSTIPMQKLMLYSPEAFNYYDYLTFLETLVGKERINIFLYEDFCINTTNFLKQFKDHFKIIIDDSKVDKTFVNASLNIGSLNRQRFKNSFSRHGIPFKHYYFHLPFLYPVNKKKIRGAKNKSYKIPLELQVESLKFALSNKKVADQFNIPDLIKYNYPLP